ncbi:MAG: patatin-like phospholipase family protein [Gammaproteobacteria bacterium]|nr:patatin-like phospholipase family protein [Gammaproteobacteria bacterium]
MAGKRTVQDLNPVRHDIGLVLPGGGARCAYQVGVLKAINEILPKGAPSPFPIISGTSAGAINATVLAARARRFHYGVSELEQVWGNFRTHQVFRSDPQTILKTSARWLASISTGGYLGSAPRALLDNEPLRQLLTRHLKISHVQDSIDRGYIKALAVTAAGYGSARSVSFYQGKPDLEPWKRVRRSGVPATLRLDHLMASIAAPLIFPAVQIGQEFYGDGAMRQATPLSPAIHLGAKRMLVIGVRNEEADPEPGPDDPVPYPSLGRVAGYMLDALLMDGLSADLERLARLNYIVNEQPGQVLEGEYEALRSIDTMIMYPSQDIREIALRHLHEMPRSVTLLMRALGALNYGGRQLVSYLLFEAGYTRELIRLGYADAMARRVELQDFLAGAPLNVPSGIVGWRDLSDEYSQRVPILQINEAVGD